MGLYAVVKGEEVDGIAIADAPLEMDGGIWIEVTDMNPIPGPTWKYVNGVFTAPVLPPPSTPIPEPIPQITRSAMIKRFTNEEYIGILAAKKTDVAVEAWYDSFISSDMVVLNSQNTIDGMNFLVSKNLLTQARADEILTPPAAPNEIPA